MSRLGEFQPADPVDEPADDKWECYFDQQEKNGYAVISRDEWHSRLDEAMTDGYAEGRREEREDMERELAAMLPGAYYMDPPDGGSVSVMEQLRRMARDAELGRRHREHAEAASACILRIEG